MRLRSLLDPGMRVLGAGWQNLEIKGLSADSRAVRPGWLFAALPGSRADGRQFIPDALARGAVAVLGHDSLASEDLAVVRVIDPEPRRRLTLMAAAFHGRQPRTIVAVTGTSGKTSVASFVRQLWQLQGLPAAALGTLGLQAPGLDRYGALTTPDPVALHAQLAELAAAGIEHLALEASSHGLDQHRLDGLRLTAAAFTNLSHDHLDYHPSPAAYLAAKRRLFAELLPTGGTAVLNADAPEFEALAATCQERGIVVLDYGRRAQRLRLVAQAARPAGQSLTLAIDGVEHALDSPLIGGFQAANLLAALGLVLASGDARPAELVPLLGRIAGAPGRMELVGRHPCGAPVFVDYAHKPDALAKVLAALRAHTAGRLVVVFGCGGDRDRAKRPAMGEIAARLADRVFITDDNPRSEDPTAIRRAILAGCPGAIEIGDRRAAIRAAAAALEAGDLLVVAGKGHETGQIVGDEVVPFDDADELRQALAGMTDAVA
jgi:UDP-N-acetylmuramoyl-L-alanyl-D-glutamate--2,6-diaminopimelate ligase